jgi:hypothetical protein
MTAVEKIIAEIDNEVDFLKTHHYIPEVRGRMIGLAFAKRVALELKELEQEHIVNAHFEGQCDETEGYPKEIAEKYYNETFKQEQ